MINILIGTKGQLIKMAPIMKEMDKREIEYNFINANQHTKILDEISKLFALKDPDFTLEGVGKNITNVKEVIWWMNKNICKYGLLKKYNIFKKGNEDTNILLVHGDAPPALLGLILGKLDKLRIAHVEAGLRSHNIFQPFPEELIRKIVDRSSDYLFTDGINNGYQNLLKEKINGKVYDTSLNTLFNAVKIAISSKKGLVPPSREYILVSIHRFETISSKKRMESIISVLNEISKDKLIIFPLHESTKVKLKSFNLLHLLEQKNNIKIMDILDYFSFVRFLNNSVCLITDGGGPQEESYYLGVPCCVLREYTERTVHSNIFLAGFNKKKIIYFVKNYEGYEAEKILKRAKNCSPANEIVRILEKVRGNV